MYCHHDIEFLCTIRYLFYDMLFFYLFVKKQKKQTESSGMINYVNHYDNEVYFIAGFHIRILFFVGRELVSCMACCDL